MMQTTIRPKWAQKSQSMQDYYDQYWGVPVHDDRQLFEMLSLEIFEAGLNWALVWQRRRALEAAFDQFDCQRLALLTEQGITDLLANPTIIRNRDKIIAIVQNARLVTKINSAGQSLDDYLWALVGHQVLPSPVPLDEPLPLKTRVSTNVAQQMKADGFRRVGPATAMSLMAAVGMIDVKHLQK